ncbi:MAG: hypothetical protein JF589_17890 [Gemmatimonadetes bacterium]|nr:hypothetical protein [Gemmatimonadota bacterium]
MPYQHVLADFIGEGHYFRHIRHVRALCAERQEALVDAAHVDDVTAHEAAMARGVRSWALSKFHLTAPARGGALVLGYGGFSEGAIRRAVGELGQALEGR